MPNHDSAVELLRRLLMSGPRRGAELRPYFKGMSQPVFSRMTQSSPDRVQALGQRKATVYVAPREIHDLGNRIPIFRISTDGDCVPFGMLISVHPRGFAFLREGWTGAPELYAGIPYFMSDLRPQGFLGRGFARRHAELGLPTRLADWSEDDAMAAIARRGEDAPGNLLIGRESFARFQASAQSTIPELSDAKREKKYMDSVERVIEGDVPGSSAAGEQPKFTIRSGARHLIVKFSPPVSTPAGRRWADLLVAESIALECIGAQTGIASARSRILIGKERVFLEGERFDRVGPRGRVGVMSLGAWDDEWSGRRDTWTLAAGRMLARRAISPEDARRIRFLDAFGGMIANTDRHFGNLSLYWDLDPSTVRLAPIYDMLPMLYAPSADGQVTERKFVPPLPTPESLAEWKEASSLARAYWEQVSKDPRISKSFRAIAAKNSRAALGTTA